MLANRRHQYDDGDDDDDDDETSERARTRSREKRKKRQRQIETVESLAYHYLNYVYIDCSLFVAI